MLECSGEYRPPILFQAFAGIHPFCFTLKCAQQVAPLLTGGASVKTGLLSAALELLFVR